MYEDVAPILIYPWFNLTTKFSLFTNLLRVATQGQKQNLLQWQFQPQGQDIHSGVPSLQEQNIFGDYGLLG